MVEEDTIFLDPVDYLYSIEVQGDFPDSVFDAHNIVYSYVFKDTWVLNGMIDSLPSGFLNDFNVNSAYATSDDTLFLLNQVILFLENNITNNQRQDVFLQYNLSVEQEFGNMIISNIEDPFDIPVNLINEPMVKQVMPRFLAKPGIELHTEIPNDEYFSKQWNLFNYGQEVNGKTGTPGADINIFPAWEFTRGEGVRIAVIDSGVSSDHPDLPNSRQDRGEFSNTVNLLYNYIYNANEPMDDPSPEIGTNAYPHGNAVAGLIGAAKNNNEGIVGVAPESIIIPYRIGFGDLGVDNSLVPIDYYAWSVYFAVDESNADIINMSFGFDHRSPFVGPMTNAIVYAIAEGVFIVCAASNSANHIEGESGFVAFPASLSRHYSGVIAVGASNRNDEQANYSPNRDHSPPFFRGGIFIPGPDVDRIDIVAPSGTIACPAFQDPTQPYNIWTLDVPGPYGYNPISHLCMEHMSGYNPSSGTNYMAYTGHFSGTSAASPQVAGALALIISANPNLTMEEVVHHLYSTADKIGGYDYDYDPNYPNQSFETGHGRINVGAAVMSALGIETCGNGDDWIVTSEETIDQPHYSQGNIIIEENGQLTVKNTVYMGDDSYIRIMDGGVLILNDDAVITKCPDGVSWDGIEVKTGGEIIINRGSVLYVKNGIIADDESSLDIRNFTLRGLALTQGTGIKITGNAQIQNLRQFDIQFFNQGMDISNIDNYFAIFSGKILKVNNGIRLVNSSALIFNIELEVEQRVAISLNGSPGTIVYGNQIDYAMTGIRAFNSDNLLIENNLIGDYFNYGSHPIQLYGCRQSRLIGNSRVIGGNTGIQAYSSNVLIESNNIEVSGKYNWPGGGIYLVNSSNSNIHNNQIDVFQSAYGIESNTNRFTNITNNYITAFTLGFPRAAVLRTMGSTAEDIQYNIIDGVANTSGVLVQNTPFNRITCNEIQVSHEGLGIYYNSNYHSIIRNIFNASMDLSIRSVIGEQPYHGNKFVGGNASAVGLNQDELEDSRFLVNSNITYHMPTNPIPGGGQWFFDNPTVAWYEDPCTSSAGPDWQPFDNDPEKICDYYYYLRVPDTDNPFKYFIGVFDLLFLSESHQNFALPDCILLDYEFQNLCGINELVSVLNYFHYLSNPQGDYDSLNILQDQLVITTDSSSKSILFSLINSELDIISLESLINNIENHSEFGSLFNQLNSIDCSSLLVNIWADVYLHYIQFLLNEGSVDSFDMTNLQQYSSLCSDIYGKPIHLARAMTATFDSTYYDQNDDCISGMEQRIVRLTPEIENTIEVYPNPTKGVVQIVFPRKYNGNLKIMDTNGRQLGNNRIEDGTKISIQLPDHMGFYILQFESLDGAVEHHRVIVID